MVVHGGQVRSQRVDLHGILRMAGCAEDAQSNYVVLHEVLQSLFLIGQQGLWGDRALSRSRHYCRHVLANAVLCLRFKTGDATVVARAVTAVDHLIHGVLSSNWNWCCCCFPAPLVIKNILDLLIVGHGQPFRIYRLWQRLVYSKLGQCHTLVLITCHVGLQGRVCQNLLEAHWSRWCRHIFYLLLGHSLILRRSLNLRCREARVH